MIQRVKLKCLKVVFESHSPPPPKKIQQEDFLMEKNIQFWIFLPFDFLTLTIILNTINMIFLN